MKKTEKLVPQVLLRRMILVLLDAAIVIFSFYFALLLRADGAVEASWWPHNRALLYQNLPWIVALYLLSFLAGGLYHVLWKYAGERDLIRLGGMIAVPTGVVYFVNHFCVHGVLFDSANAMAAVLIFLLVGVGLWYSIKTRFVQIRCFKEGWNKVFGNLTLNGKKGGGGMSSFQALATAIAAQVGTGIIVGVAGAILTGGPGAVFWMWVISFFGMATIYAEATLAQETRIVEKDGNVKGGPVYYITTAFKGGFGKFLAGFFAVAITLALGFMGCMVQSNSIGATMETAFGIPSWVVGIVLIVICAFIFLGGVQRLASVTEKVVPLMAAVFLFGGLIVLAVRIKYIPETFAMIFRYAFEPQAIVGGGFGYAIKLAISQGAKRGLFSNEAGMGSTPHAHALANVKNPHEQGTVAIIGVFIDMFIILTLNALVIISTLYAGDGPLAGCGAAALSSTFNKTNLAQCAFGTVFGYKAGSMFVAICLFFFAFSTILSWNLFGKINMVYLFGKKSANVYTLLALIFIFLGTTMSNDLVWELSDMLNQLMVIPNAIALLALTSHVVKHSHTPDRLSGRENG